jgi:hypothetical protein
MPVYRKLSVAGAPAIQVRFDSDQQVIHSQTAEGILERDFTVIQRLKKT